MSKKQPIGRNPQHMAGGVPVRGDKGLAVQEQKGHAGFLEARSDGWADLISGARTSRDPRMHTRFGVDHELPYQELERMFRRDPLSRRVVSKVPQLMTRDPWTISGDSDNDIWQYLEKKLFMPSYRRGLEWGRLYGGGILVIGADDGRDWAEPLNDARLRTIEFFRVYDRYSVTGTLDDWNQDPMSARFGQRDWYTIYPRGVIVPTMMFRVHYTRVIQCDGMTTTDVQRARNYGWDDSILSVVYDDIRRYMTGLDDASGIIRDFMQAVLNVENLQTLLSSGETGKKQWKQRMEMMDLTRHVLNMMVLGKDEVYEKKASSVTGLPDLLDRLAMQVCQSSDMPMSILFGRSAAGLNASGDNEVRSWYDNVGAEQREKVAPGVQRVAQIVLACKDYKGARPEGEDISVQFPTLWKMTAAEEAKLRYDVAQADALYITNNVLSPDEVAVSRFGGDSFSTETTLGYERNPEEEPEPPEPAPVEPTASGGTGSGTGGTPPAPGAKP